MSGIEQCQIEYSVIAIAIAGREIVEVHFPVETCGLRASCVSVSSHTTNDPKVLVSFTYKHVGLPRRRIVLLQYEVRCLKV